MVDELKPTACTVGFILSPLSGLKSRDQFRCVWSGPGT